MIYKERLFKILRNPYISEKASIALKNYNVVVFRVEKYATKLDIKNAVVMLFSVKVKNVNIVITGKLKGSSNNIRYRGSWKKAYVKLEKGQKINFIDKQE